MTRPGTHSVVAWCIISISPSPICKSPFYAARPAEEKEKMAPTFTLYHSLFAPGLVPSSTGGTELNGDAHSCDLSKKVCNSVGSVLPSFDPDSMVARLYLFSSWNPVFTRTQPLTQVVSGVGDGTSPRPFLQSAVPCFWRS